MVDAVQFQMTQNQNNCMCLKAWNMVAKLFARELQLFWRVISTEVKLFVWLWRETLGTQPIALLWWFKLVL